MNVDIVYLAIVLVVVLFSMVIHELAHGYVAYILGDDTAKKMGRLTLNPIKHVDPFLTVILPISLALVGAPVFGGAKPVLFNPNNIKNEEWGVALVAISGPIINFLIAFVSFGLWSFTMPENEIVNQVFASLVYVNLGFFVFNLIPLPPLDGSRVLYAFAPDFVRDFMKKIESFSIWILFAILILANSFVIRLIGAVVNWFVVLFGDVF